jgi:hypothetical protein
VVRKKWWEKQAVWGSNRWCVVGQEIFNWVLTQWEPQKTTKHSICHISNLPPNAKLIAKNLTQHQAQGLCKLLNQGESP